MTGIWRYLFRDNPMQIETLRAARRLTVTAGRTAAVQRNVARAIVGMLCLLYVWFLFTILSYREDISAGIFWFEFVLLTLLVPGSLYQAISGERERLTWDSLILTNLSPTRILAGKLLWRLGLAAGILLLFTPPLLLTHFASRFQTAYTLGMMFWMQTILASWCVFLATFTLWVSARTKRSVVTLSIVTVFLLAFLILTPALVVAFGGRADLNNYASGHGSIYRILHPVSEGTYALPDLIHSPMAYVGSLLIHLNPGYVIGALDYGTLNSASSDFWRDFFTPTQKSPNLVMGIGIFTFLPALYLGLAALCVNRTRKALARLGLPGGATR